MILLHFIVASQMLDTYFISKYLIHGDLFVVAELVMYKTSSPVKYQLRVCTAGASCDVNSSPPPPTHNVMTGTLLFEGSLQKFTFP